MSTYLPEGVDMRRAGYDEHEYEAYLPEALNPLDVESPGSEGIAAEIVGTYLANAASDPETAHLQHHACQISIYPWAITRKAFDRLTDELPQQFPWFPHELAYEVWFSDVAFSLTKREDQP